MPVLKRNPLWILHTLEDSKDSFYEFDVAWRFKFPGLALLQRHLPRTVAASLHPQVVLEVNLQPVRTGIQTALARYARLLCPLEDWSWHGAYQ